MRCGSFWPCLGYGASWFPIARWQTSDCDIEKHCFASRVDRSLGTELRWLDFWCCTDSTFWCRHAGSRQRSLLCLLSCLSSSSQWLLWVRARCLEPWCEGLSISWWQARARGRSWWLISSMLADPSDRWLWQSRMVRRLDNWWSRCCELAGTRQSYPRGFFWLRRTWSWWRRVTWTCFSNYKQQYTICIYSDFLQS